MEEKVQNKYVPINVEYNFPYSYWIGVGFNSDMDGTIFKNGIGTWDETNKYTTLKERDNYNRQYIKQSIEELGLPGLMNLWARKIDVQWSTGAMGINNRNYEISKSFPRIYEYIYGSQKAFILTFSQIIYILLMIGYAFASKKMITEAKEYCWEKLLILFVIGVFIFHTVLWEVQERYSFLVVICLLIFGSKGLADLTEKASSILKYNAKFITLLCVTGLILGLSFDYKKTAPNLVDLPVVGQNFFRTENMVLKPHNIVKEQIYIPNNFNKVNLPIQGEKSDFLVYLIDNNDKKYSINHELKYLTGGKYTIVIKNISENDIFIPIGKSESRLGLLQKPINRTKNEFLKFFISYSTEVGLSSKALYLWLIINILVLGIFMLFRKKLIN